MVQKGLVAAVFAAFSFIAAAAAYVHVSRKQKPKYPQQKKQLKLTDLPFPSLESLIEEHKKDEVLKQAAKRKKQRPLESNKKNEALAAPTLDIPDTMNAKSTPRKNISIHPAKTEVTTHQTTAVEQVQEKVVATKSQQEMFYDLLALYAAIKPSETTSGDQAPEFILTTSMTTSSISSNSSEIYTYSNNSTRVHTEWHAAVVEDAETEQAEPAVPPTPGNPEFSTSAFQSEEEPELVFTSSSPPGAQATPVHEGQTQIPHKQAILSDFSQLVGRNDLFSR